MKITYLTNGMVSTLVSALELTRRLRAAGHHVTIVGPPAAGPRIERAGLPFVPLDGDRPYVEAAAADPPRRGLLLRPWALWRWLRGRRRLRQASLADRGIERLVRDLDPDVLLIDVELHVAVLSTAHLGIPTLLPAVFFSLYRRPGLPPLHTRLPLATTAAGRWRIRLAWTKLRLASERWIWRRRVERWSRGDVWPPVTYDSMELDDLRAVARAKGFAWRREVSRGHWQRPYAYVNRPILCFSAQALELPHEPFATMHYVGPMIHHPRRDDGHDPESRDAWKRFQAARDRDRPLIYASLGSYWSADRDLLARVIDVFRQRTDWDLVLGLGGVLATSALDPVPPNVTLLAWAPQLAILGQAHAALVHGGNTSIHECLRYGVPMVVVSTGHVDQDGNATRVAHHGVGVLGDKERDDATSLAGKIEHVLTDAALHRRVRAMGEAIVGYEEDGLAVRLIESAAQGGTR